ncbi:MAG: PrsW family glutamic-type intramembrane protease [Acidimicrobiales bacterium]
MTVPLPPPATRAAPGWYRDPWGASPWRWWDGSRWTAHVAAPRAAHKPRLPSWLSVPVVAGALLTVPLVVYLVLSQPVSVALGLVPLAIVLPVLSWLDRVEPEPLTSRLHAVLWGAVVAGTISAIVNGITAATAGETAAAVVSAPLIEEATKGLGIVWALRRHEIDGIMDGVVYAGWVALGFAVVEDFTYFAGAASSGILVEVFVVRALLTPFAHPLFTAWIGLAIGIAVARRRSVAVNAVWGYALAVGSHAAWNGSLSYADATGDAATLAIAAACFVGLFVAAVVTVVVIRRSEQRDFLTAVPMLAQRYGVPQHEAQVFGYWRSLLLARRRLPRGQRSDFDAVHAALARLALLHARPGPVDLADELRLVDQLQRARASTGA